MCVAPWDGACEREATECFAVRLLSVSIGKFSETSPEKKQKIHKSLLVSQGGSRDHVITFCCSSLQSRFAQTMWCVSTTRGST